MNPSQAASGTQIHTDRHPDAGRTVTLGNNPSLGDLAGQEFRLEDWWDRVAGKSWMFSDGNPAAMNYALRTGLSGGVPIDNEVVYGKVEYFGHLIHVSEIAPAVD